MSETVIKVESISKQYRLGQVGTGTLSHDLNRWWHRIRGKEDPYLQIGEKNDRTVKGNSEYVWALRDIDFEVRQGEVLGVIGRNGAGKSTLLKILSRTTTPTRGNIKMKGRVASLLEVGTGFHPELSGRDNVFLNGAILGMTKREIVSKFDEIVDFAGIDRYIDTPVKRYSSGMYVRLAFAVAAYLEPEILIVDEVLAVGDAEFQKKCLGKMKDVSDKDGRTVLFVSHNMSAIASLCSRLLFLKDGCVEFTGEVEEGIDKYMDFEEHSKGFSILEGKQSTLWETPQKHSRLLSIETLNSTNRRQVIFKTGESLKVRVKFNLLHISKKIEMGLFVSGKRESLVGACLSTAEGFKDYRPGEQFADIEIPSIAFMPGNYTLGLWIFCDDELDSAYEHAIDIEVLSDNQFTGNFIDYNRFKHYQTFIRSNWKISQ